MVFKPMVISAKFNPNPVKAGESTLLSVIVLDAQIGQVPDTWYSGELRSGAI